MASQKRTDAFCLFEAPAGDLTRPETHAPFRLPSHAFHLSYFLSFRRNILGVTGGPKGNGTLRKPGIDVANRKTLCTPFLCETVKWKHVFFLELNNLVGRNFVFTKAITGNVCISFFSIKKKKKFLPQPPIHSSSLWLLFSSAILINVS